MRWRAGASSRCRSGWWWWCNDARVENVELWDLLDDAGRVTGEVFPRGADGWPPDRFHLVVATCVVRSDGRLLMTRRAAGKDYPLTWEFPGGSALAGEPSRRAAARELREETGLVVPDADLQLVARHLEGVAFVDLYVTAVSGRPRLRLLPDEVDRAEWVTIAEAGARRAAGQMAHYWTGRLGAAWPALSAAAAAAALAWAAAAAAALA